MKSIIIIAFTLSFVAVSFAQSTKAGLPNLTGLWAVTNVESNAKIPGMDVAAEVDREMRLEITHDDPQLKHVIQKKGKDGYVAAISGIYFTDGRGETNDRLGKNSPLAQKSKTKWNGKKITITYKDGWTKKDDFELLGDNKTLTLKHFVETSFDKYYVLITYTKLNT